jgi:hypothetical protein
LRNILFILTALFVLSLTAVGQDNMSISKQKEKNKTRNHGQKEEKEDPNPFPLRRVEYGLNFGAYFANKYSANYYNGTPGNVNNVNYIMTNPTWYREIQGLLGASQTDLVIVQQNPTSGYPTNMHYNVAFSGGLFLRVNFDRKNAVFIEANYAQLKAGDVIVLQVNPNYSFTYQDLRMEQVIGKEGRVMMDLGYQRSFPLKSRINLFIQGGVTMCYTQVIKSTFVVEGREYNLVNIYGDQVYVPNTSQQTNTIYQNAFGFGGYLGVGAGIPLTAAFGLEPGFFAHYYPTNLEGYPDFKPSFGLYLRILLHFGASDDE